MNDSPTTNAEQALRARGVVAASQVARSAAPDLISAWCAYAARQRHMGPGALVDAIRSGRQPPSTSHRPSANLIDQRQYGEQIVAWLTENLPEVCGQDPAVIEWERELYGEEAARKLAACTGPHPTAIAAVIRLHFTRGKTSFTAGEYGPMILGAVKVANEEAIADYQAIAARRDTEEDPR